MLKIGHRGAPGNPREKENTLYSFGRAFGLGADGIEFDVQITKDSILVAIHHLPSKRLRNQKKKVSDFTLSELRGSEKNPETDIPTLEDVLDMFSKQFFLNIELKDRGFAAPVKKMILDRHLEKSVLISTFDEDDSDPGTHSSWDELQIFREKIPLALLASDKKVRQLGDMNYIKRAKECGATGINPEHTAVTKNLVALAHNFGLKIFVWTVNEPADIQRFKAMGVDGIISDFPERL